MAERWSKCLGLLGQRQFPAEIWYFVRMRRMFFGFILTGALLWGTGCRTDAASKASSQVDEQASAVPEKPARSPELLQDNRPLIVCFGDSLTAGYGADVGDSYPDFLQKDLSQNGFRYRVVNQGESGDTTKDGVDRLPGILAMKPAIVVVEFGGNDGLRGVSVETMRANLNHMVEPLKGSGAKVVVAGITLPPSYGQDYIKQFNATYPMLGKRFSVPVIPFILQNVYGVDGMMQADGIHATEKGNEIVAQNVLSAVLPLVKK